MARCMHLSRDTRKTCFKVCCRLHIFILVTFPSLARDPCVRARKEHVCRFRNRESLKLRTGETCAMDLHPNAFAVEYRQIPPRTRSSFGTMKSSEMKHQVSYSAWSAAHFMLVYGLGGALIWPNDDSVSSRNQMQVSKPRFMFYSFV